MQRHGRLAQMDRALASEAIGREFESLIAHHAIIRSPPEKSGKPAASAGFLLPVFQRDSLSRRDSVNRTRKD